MLRGHEDAVIAVAFSPDNRALMTGSEDKTARLWDLTAKGPVDVESPFVQEHPEGAVSAVGIRADSGLVTGGGEKTMPRWPLQINDLIDLARGTVGRNLTAEEWKLYFPGELYHKTSPNLPGP